MDFGSPRSYAVGDAPRAVIAANFDRAETFGGETRADDLAVVNAGTGTVSILRSDGHGGFAGQRQWHVGVAPRAIVADFFDADRDPDLAVANEGSDSVSVLLGRSGAEFVPRRTHAVGARPSAIAAALLDDDAFVDLAVANTGSATVSILRGRKGGDFAPQRVLPAGPSPVALVIEDLDADGDADLAVADADGRIGVLRGDGRGAFTAPAFVQVSGSLGPVAVADVDRDGDPDLLACDAALPVVWVLRGSTGASFTPPVAVTVGSRPVGLAATDLDGGSDPDLAVVGEGPPALALLEGGDAASFAAPVAVHLAGTQAASVSSVHLGGPGPDLVVADAAGDRVTVLTNRGFEDEAPPGRGDGFVVSSTTGRLLAPPLVRRGAVHAAVADGRHGWIIGGTFTQAGGVGRAGLARVRRNGRLDTSWRPALRGTITALATRGGRLYVGGRFRVTGRPGWRSLAALDLRTGRAVTWRAGVGLRARRSGRCSRVSVDRLAVDAGRVYALGCFRRANGVSRPGLAAFDATTGDITEFNPRGLAPDPYVQSSVAYLNLAAAAGRVFVHGFFDVVGGGPSEPLAALDGRTGRVLPWRAGYLGPDVSAMIATPTALYTANDDEGILQFDVTTARRRRLPGHAGAMALHGNALLIGGDIRRGAGGLRPHDFAAIDLRTRRLLPWQPCLGQYIDTVAIVPSGRRVLIAAEATDDLGGGVPPGVCPRPFG